MQSFLHLHNNNAESMGCFPSYMRRAHFKKKLKHMCEVCALCCEMQCCVCENVGAMECSGHIFDSYGNRRTEHGAEHSWGGWNWFPPKNTLLQFCVFAALPPPCGLREWKYWREMHTQQTEKGKNTTVFSSHIYKKGSENANVHICRMNTKTHLTPSTCLKHPLTYK